MLRLLVATSCVFAAAGAVAEPARLSGAALQEMLPGALLEFDTPLRTTIPVRFSEDGLVSGQAGVLAPVLGAARDRGRWWVENDCLCVKWFRWFEARKRCVIVRQDGDQLHWRGEDRSGIAVIIERAKTTAVAAAPGDAATAAKTAAAAPKDETKPQPPAAIAAAAPVMSPVTSKDPADEPTRMLFATAGATGPAPFHLAPASKPEAPVSEAAVTETPMTEALAPAPTTAPEASPATAQPQSAPRETTAAAKAANAPRKLAPQRTPTAASSLVMRTSFRVARVDEDDILNVRSGPSAFAEQIGAIPAQGRGVKIIGPCRDSWCPIEHGRTKGWVNGYYLAAEGSGPEPTLAGN